MTDWNQLDRVARTPRTQIEVEIAGWMRGGQATAVSAVESPVRKRLQRLVSETSKALVERDDLVRCCVASLASGVPMVVMGPPGTGKSMCVRLIAERCMGASADDASTYFEYLLTSHTMPEELFGPPDLAKLRTGEFSRRTDGMLPDAEFAFLDEVFRGGTHILNTLLAVVNERKFHDGPTVRSIPLLGVIAAANHPPTDPDVAAFYDRFPIRLWIQSIFERDGDPLEERLANLLSASADHHRSALSDRAGARHSKIACTNDFRAAEAILAVKGRPGKDGSERAEEFAEAIEKVRRPLQLSDRSIDAIWRFGAALDWIDGRDLNGATSDGAGGHLEALTLAAGTSQLHRQAERLINAVRNGQGVRSNH